MPEQTADTTVRQPVQVSPIGYVMTDYARPEEAPAQATENYREIGRVVVYDEYAEGLAGLERWSHIWLVTWLHAQEDDQATSMKCLPRGGTRGGPHRGVFSTRSPNRPSRLGMSLVRLVSVDGNVVHFHGVDLVNGTPVLDIKPWVRGTDIPPDLAF
ncbi:tRNA (N6-threonylcarbamoyladenosine(37)-N6)-methyltransferase TrmO [Sphaerisporangium melleum]|uniref:tRNA (N6-threonylcarbamoyladenosine(37)-N6)-methyltransferase TrmO n=1 Tax=Sphaerisporangium melleum TaxID=321316 RepID=A0A917RFT5_9ACTN|nr:tRNA (N6-threonylcarbamoyladenosine(37)-N6)-methyltransferase TrmO [Sphaerisporangium melleum]GII73934.1 tRNA (N6-threonylcarbamoyladenosine(37)-N6)-methyltransferase TrmO [Sphaerisporangium melleum]